MTEAPAQTESALDFTVERRPDPLPDAQRDAVLANPGFGKTFTDHMVLVTWTRGRGWHDARITAYGPLTLDPSAAVLHYAQEIFEGMKAYRHADGSIWTFRPDQNAARFARSARRLALPELPPAAFVQSLKALVEVDQAWVPSSEHGEASLYLRPFMFASEAFLGVRPAAEVTYCVIASPAGPYFSGGLKPVSIWVSSEYVRAAPGGTGAAKCGGNYAASLAAQVEASEHGCDQVVFLDGLEHRWVEELGGMNVFFVLQDGSIVTPELTGTILEGITRDSIVDLAKGSATTSPSAASRSTSGARASTRARSPRSSPAARPPWSPRSAGSPGTAATPSSTAARSGRSRRGSAPPCSTSRTAGRRTPTAGWPVSSTSPELPPKVARPAERTASGATLGEGFVAELSTGKRSAPPAASGASGWTDAPPRPGPGRPRRCAGWRLLPRARRRASALTGSTCTAWSRPGRSRTSGVAPSSSAGALDGLTPEAGFALRARAVSSLVRERSWASHHAGLAVAQLPLVRLDLDRIDVCAVVRHESRSGTVTTHPLPPREPCLLVGGVPSVSTEDGPGADSGPPRPQGCGRRSRRGPAQRPGECGQDRRGGSPSRPRSSFDPTCRPSPVAGRPSSRVAGEEPHRLLLDGLGLDFRTQVDIRDAAGFVGRVDFLVEGRIVLEFDGLSKYAGADGREALAREKTREDRLRALGFEVVRLTWSDLDRPEQVAQLVRKAQRPSALACLTR